ncbi:MAG: tRNA uridine-5-carboxymethylaminomethyl(34) synthesis GTPase MnmE [Bdellovibrionales bacterium]
MNDDKTIFAPASAIGKAGVTVFRISGVEALQAIKQLCVPADDPEPRKASLRIVKHPITDEIIDRAVVLFFQAPESFTGEDVVELHTHGGRAVANAVVDALSALPRFRIAEAGEFTRRAFENGKMDLTEAEAIADLVHAETEAQRKQAFRQMEGALGNLYGNWQERLSQGLAWMEASIDFSDEDLPDDLMDKQTADLKALRKEIMKHLDDKHRGERLREGFSIVLLGPPNAGKSSILNALARRDAAIVSPTAGTTRDIIEVHLDLGGYPVILADTAGLKDLSPETLEEDVELVSHGKIEVEGIRRAQVRAANADLKIIVFDGAHWPKMDKTSQGLIDKDALVVVNKSDLIKTKKPAAGKESIHPLFISALTGAGIDALLKKLEHEIEHRFVGTGSPPLTRARHRAALEECADHLGRALQSKQADLRAEDVRQAMRSLGRITGRVDVEDLLDIIFRDFCIGK